MASAKPIEGSVEKRTVEVEFNQTCTITLKKERANCSTISFRVTYTLPVYGLPLFPYILWKTLIMRLLIVNQETLSSG